MEDELRVGVEENGKGMFSILRAQLHYLERSLTMSRAWLLSLSTLNIGSPPAVPPPAPSHLSHHHPPTAISIPTSDQKSAVIIQVRC